MRNLQQVSNRDSLLLDARYEVAFASAETAAAAVTLANTNVTTLPNKPGTKMQMGNEAVLNIFRSSLGRALSGLEIDLGLSPGGAGGM